MKTKQKYLLPLVIIILGIITIIYLGYDKIKEKVTQPQVTTDWEIAAGDAIKTNDFKQCDKIKDNKYKTVCINNIALNKANETGDVSYCDKVDGKLITKAYCQENAASQNSQVKEDVSQCDKIEDQQKKTFCKNSFYFTLALKKNDPAQCDQAPDQQTKNDCKDIFLLTTQYQKDPQAFDCQKLSTDDAKNDCQKLKTRKDKNPDFCKELKSPVILDACFAATYQEQTQVQNLPNPLNQSKQ